MRVLKRNPWLPSLGVLLAATMLVAGYARADVTTDEPGSIVIFPKVISDGNRDTLIQLTNTSTMASNGYVHCVYVDTSPASPGTCAGSTPPAQACSDDADCLATNNCDPQTPTDCCIRCQPHDFKVDLTPLQPTVWRVSVGRDSSDQTRGFFLGSVPQKPLFMGELKCFQTDADGVPSGGNSLKGEAIIEDLATGQISQYNGIAIKAKNAATVTSICSGGLNNGLKCPTNDSATDCPGGVCKTTVLLNDLQYNACPSQLLVNHYAAGASDPFTGATVNSELTLVPCSEDLEVGKPTRARVTFNAYNEMEQPVVSKIVPFTCWLNINLADSRLAFDVGPFGSTFGKTRVFPSSSAWPGVIGVLEEFHSVPGQAAGTAAVNLHATGSRPTDTITVPAP